MDIKATRGRDVKLMALRYRNLLKDEKFCKDEEGRER